MKYCIIILLLMAGCGRTVYVPASEKHDQYRGRERTDSIVMRDSVAVVAIGDTVVIYRDRWRERIHVRRDTIRIHDSIPYPVTVEKQVRHVPKAYRWSLWISIAAIAWAGWKMFRR